MLEIYKLFEGIIVVMICVFIIMDKDLLISFRIGFYEKFYDWIGFNL